ncbi:MAG TPA: hypothetical protein VLB32_00975 [Candidatus Acidoferrales bacterium]|nr:hypothetical protein [Candidatus Acidoferrales bacterium]
MAQAKTNSQPKKDTSGRNRILMVVAFTVVTYFVTITIQGVMYVAGLLGPQTAPWGVWVIAPLAASAVAGRMLLAWLRGRAASKSLQKERDVLMEHVRELTYNINNPLNSITANLIALKTEYNPGSVEQIETSSRMISRIVMKLANIDVQALLQAQQGAGGGVNVEQMGRAGSL